MKYFLNPKLRAELTKTLDLNDGLDPNLRRFTVDVEDDIEKADEAMLFHVLTIVRLRKEGKHDECLVGLACVAALMSEARSRGLGEKDLPHAFEAILDDLKEHGIIRMQ